MDFQVHFPVHRKGHPSVNYFVYFRHHQKSELEDDLGASYLVFYLAVKIETQQARSSSHHHVELSDYLPVRWILSVPVTSLWICSVVASIFNFERLVSWTTCLFWYWECPVLFRLDPLPSILFLHSLKVWWIHGQAFYRLQKCPSETLYFLAIFFAMLLSFTYQLSIWWCR